MFLTYDVNRLSKMLRSPSGHVQNKGDLSNEMSCIPNYFCPNLDYFIRHSFCSGGGGCGMEGRKQGLVSDMNEVTDNYA